MSTSISIWIAALLTVAVLSFLYKDNAFYKLAEFIFVGCSAGYYVAQYWDTVFVDELAAKLFPESYGLEGGAQWALLPGVAIGITILMRLVPNVGWVSRIGIAFIVGFNAGIQIFSQLSGFILKQLTATLQPFYSFESWGALVKSIVIAVGAITGISYFYFSREQKGWFGWITRVGIWFLMVGFGAAYGNTVMTRISIMAGRMIFILGDVLGLIAF